MKTPNLSRAGSFAFRNAYDLLGQKAAVQTLNLQKTISYFCTVSYSFQSTLEKISKMLHVNWILTRICWKSYPETPWISNQDLKFYSFGSEVCLTNEQEEKTTLAKSLGIGGWFPIQGLSLLILRLSFKSQVYGVELASCSQEGTSHRHACGSPTPSLTSLFMGFFWQSSWKQNMR